MKKYFFVSDIHSYSSCLKDALKRAGFKKTAENHVLVVCGDIFDRGFETLEVFNYLKSIPKDRRVMIKGNHELLYLELLEKRFPGQHDFSNGTVRTFCQIAGVDESELNVQAKLAEYYIMNGGKDDPTQKSQVIQEVNNIWAKVRDSVAKSPVTEWIKSDEWVNYFEIDDLVCVHSFIPVRVKQTDDTKWIRNYPTYQVHPMYLEVVKDWRTAASSLDWEDATWGCPYKSFDAGLFNDEITANPNKKLVCGHWHVSDFHNHYGDTPDDRMNLKLYFSNNLVGLDACTAMSQFCNVLVYDQKSGNYYDQFKNKLPITAKVSDEIDDIAAYNDSTEAQDLDITTSNDVHDSAETELQSSEKVTDAAFDIQD